MLAKSQRTVFAVERLLSSLPHLSPLHLAVLALSRSDGKGCRAEPIST